LFASLVFLKEYRLPNFFGVKIFAELNEVFIQNLVFYLNIEMTIQEVNINTASVLYWKYQV
jgi:hypothetical protein